MLVAHLGHWKAAFLQTSYVCALFKRYRFWPQRRAVVGAALGHLVVRGGSRGVYGRLAALPLYLAASGAFLKPAEGVFRGVDLPLRVEAFIQVRARAPALE